MQCSEGSFETLFIPIPSTTQGGFGVYRFLADHSFQCGNHPTSCLTKRNSLSLLTITSAERQDQHQQP
jgi:hypothetical protein